MPIDNWSIENLYPIVAMKWDRDSYQGYILLSLLTFKRLFNDQRLAQVKKYFNYIKTVYFLNISFLLNILFLPNFVVLILLVKIG